MHARRPETYAIAGKVSLKRDVEINFIFACLLDSPKHSCLNLHGGALNPKP